MDTVLAGLEKRFDTFREFGIANVAHPAFKARTLCENNKNVLIDVVLVEMRIPVIIQEKLPTQTRCAL